MAKFTGKCVGGPTDGMMLDHWSKTKEYFRGLPEMSDYIKMGEYHLNDFGQWHWHATKEGFDEACGIPWEGECSQCLELYRHCDCDGKIRTEPLRMTGEEHNLRALAADSTKNPALRDLAEKSASRIAELEAAISKALRKADANGMGAWPAFVELRKVMGKH